MELLVRQSFAQPAMFHFCMTLLAVAVLSIGVPAAAQAGNATPDKGTPPPSGTTGKTENPADTTATIAAISPGHATARVVIADLALLVIAVVLTIHLIGVLNALKDEVKGGGAPAVDSHWGGFGGGMGGWRVSPALSYVFAALLLAGLLGTIAHILDRRVRVVPSSGTQKSAPAANTAPAADTATVDAASADSTAVQQDTATPGADSAVAAGGSPAAAPRDSTPAS